jgi:hypothetical protein
MRVLLLHEELSGSKSLFSSFTYRPTHERLMGVIRALRMRSLSFLQLTEDARLDLVPYIWIGNHGILQACPQQVRSA